MSADDVHERVRARYARAAIEPSSCCAPGTRQAFGGALYGDDERGTLPERAVQASLGCGNPTAVAELREGETVLDLGSGGGIDVLLSARRVGPAGRAYGLDMTDEMLELARRNAAEAGAANVEFVKGRIGISDIVRAGPDDGTPTTVSCAAGAITPVAYEDELRHAGLGHVEVTLTDALGAGLSNAIISAVKPATSIRPMRDADWPAVREICEAGCQAGSSWRLPMSASTRRRISSRIGRTASTPRPAGSSSSQSS